MKLMKKIRLHNREFELYLPSWKINERLKELASQLNNDLKNKDIVFLGVLNGAFIFAADLIRLIELPCSVSFAKFSSYSGLQSTGTVDELIGIKDKLEDKCVVIVEDIVDTGLTMDKLVNAVRTKKPSEIHIISLLFKEDAHKGKYKPEYTGFIIPNLFVLGYGLDYEGQGRNFEDIYIQSEVD